MHPPPEPPSFAEILRRNREDAGLTQEELAERAALSPRSVVYLEHGERAPYRDTARRLADALRLTGAGRALFEAAARDRRASSGARSAGPARDQAGISSDEWQLPLLGRAAELAMLDGHLAGHGTPVLLLAGPPGMGKSRLLREASRRAGAAGWTVLEGGCARSGGQQPFAPILEALERYVGGRSDGQLREELRGCAWLLRLMPDLPQDATEPLPQWTLGPEHERHLLFKSVRRFLSNVAGAAGTLLVLDDLQWVGADALSLLTMLLKHETGVALRVVAAYRDTDVPPEHILSAALADWAEGQRAAQLAIGPLAPREAEDLLLAQLGRQGEAGAARVVQVLQRTGGVPFFVVSFARDLDREGGNQEVPWDVRQSIRRRVLTLSETARVVVATAAHPPLFCML
jgi:transcriptional regulator with XRE-family HTH domain